MAPHEVIFTHTGYRHRRSPRRPPIGFAAVVLFLLLFMVVLVGRTPSLI